MRTQLMLFCLKVLGERLAPSRFRLRFFGLLDLGLQGRLGSLVECPSLVALNDRWSRRWRCISRRTLFALLTLRYGK
jgi:hypothetical protein